MSSPNIDASVDVPEATDADKPLSPYHSLPESGEAKGVGLKSSSRDVESPPSKVEAFEQELPTESPGASHRFRITDAQLKTIIMMLYLSVGAIFGSLFRIILAQLFGEECRNPDTVGWLAASSPLCVTADGEVDSVNGIIFADFPSNMFGSFIMGLMVHTDVLGLPVSVPIAWLKPDHFFQKYDVLHLAIRTGFCGSLTTFSSWNSDMVVMIYATGVADTRSMIIRAILGYIVGMETALGSFAFGRTVALWIHRWSNPILAKEEDAVIRRKEQGVYINNKLPEFERRFLPDLDMEMDEIHPKLLELLERWRDSTKDARRVGSEQLPLLIEVEDCVLVQRQKAPPVLKEDAAEAKWDLAALEEWVGLRDADRPVLIQPDMPDRFYSWKIATVIFTICVCPLLVGLFLLNGEDDYSVTYRTMVYAALLSAPGALLRWKLSEFNGKLPSQLWGWLPVGTLLANVAGSIVSISAIATELRLEKNMIEYGREYGFNVVGSLRAVRVGFAGSLTTVSTFASEVAAFMKCSQQQYRAYLYILITILVSCLAAVFFYGLILFVF